MAKNDNLHKAKGAKNDEFYTRIEDVAEELRHYKKHFAGKVVFCNCDDPTWSAFWRYFHLNFAELGLKKLISTHYDRTEPTRPSWSSSRRSMSRWMSSVTPMHPSRTVLSPK